MKKIKYTESQIQLAIDEYKNGMSLQAVADRFGFTRSWLRIRFVERGIKFRHRWASQWRRCRICERVLKVKNNFSKKSYKCKTCAAKHSYWSNIKIKFGISKSEYLEMLHNQNNACAICKSEPINRRLSIDYNHETMEIRGLLCVNCNTAIGMFKEDQEIFQSAIEYMGSNT